MKADNRIKVESLSCHLQNDPTTEAVADCGNILWINRGVVLQNFHGSCKPLFCHGEILSDGTGDIILLLWQNLLEEIPERYALVPGNQIQVVGVIDEYVGDLEIIPREGAGVVVLTQGTSLPIEDRQVKDITPSDEGRVFTVEGVVIRTEGDGWLKVWLGDSTGEILEFVPERTVPYLPPALEAGGRLQVTGEVDIYKGILEIIPLAGVDIVVR